MYYNLVNEVSEKLKHGKIKEAHDIALNFIAENPKEKEGYIALADIYYEEDNNEEALKTLKNALELYPENKMLLEYLLDLEILTFRYSQAKETLNKLFSIGNVSSKVHGQYAILLSFEGRHKEAIKEYKKSLELDKKDVNSLINMGLSYNAIYDYDNAYDSFIKAYKIEKSVRIEKLIENSKQNKNNSLFGYDDIIDFPGTPDLFHLSVPKCFNAKTENGALYIKSEDKKIVVVLTYETKEEELDDKYILETFKNFRDESGALCSIIRPLKIQDRAEYKDKAGSIIFIARKENIDMYYAVTVIAKNNKLIFCCFSSVIKVSEKLIKLSETIIDTIYFK